MAITTFGFKEENGLVFCNDLSTVKNNSEKLYIHEAQKLGIDAVFFRRFYREGEDKPYKSDPSVCILNKEDSYFNTEEHIKLHAALWTSGNNEVYILKGQTRLNIINARKPAKPNKDNKLSVESLRLMGDTIEHFDYSKFSAYLFNSGTFWEQTEFQDQINERNSPYLYLLDYLMATRELLFADKTFKLAPETIDKLLVTSILIKFLEEREDDEGKNTLKSIYEKYNVENFSDAINASLCLTIFNELSREFHGRIFDKFTQDEKETIEKADLNKIAAFLRGDIDVNTNQLFIWEQYNFKYLPAEVISAIYENFIQAESLRLSGVTEKGVVYTPIHLVNFLVDEAMPLNKPELFQNESFKILDPACGSGVFLVATYKRLLQWWAINNSNGSTIKYPQSEKALKILENNIFGIDIKETAILVSIFGLTTALLDKLTPQEIWNNLKFKDLSEKNIQNNNFFDSAVNLKKEGAYFDLVIGNPPFNIEAGKRKEEIIKPYVLKELKLNHPVIPNNNFALHFFETSMLFCKKACMIIPSNVILYNKASQNYRNLIFTDYTIRKIYDFTHLRETLFTKKKKKGFKNEKKTGRTPVIALIAENKASERQSIEHIVVKRLFASEKKIGFEIDYYDKHFVRWQWAVDESKSFVWKTNLLGGGRLFHLIYRLSLLPTLLDFIQAQDGWKQIRGFEGGSKFTLERQNRIIGINLDNEPVIEYDVTIKSDILKDDFMYKPPFMLIDQILGKHSLSACIIPQNNTYGNKPHLYYNRDFIGISVPGSDEFILKNIYTKIQSNNSNQLNYQLYILARSSSSLILTETDVNKSEILDIPYPEDSEYLNLSPTEKLVQEDVLNYYIHLGKAISNNSAGSIFEDPVRESQLAIFGKVFCDVLNEIYANEGKSWQIGSFKRSEQYIIYQFGFGANEKFKTSLSTSNLEEGLCSLVEDIFSNSAAFYKRIVRVYHHEDGFDCIYLIKPYTNRYWLNSIALRDADDTFIDLNKAGY